MTGGSLSLAAAGILTELQTDLGWSHFGDLAPGLSDRRRDRAIGELARLGLVSCKPLRMGQTLVRLTPRGESS